jgi:hypothetical protein
MNIGGIREVLHTWGVILQINSEDRGAETRLCRVEERLLGLRFHLKFS